MSLVVHPTGNYRFLPGIAPYSCGVVSSPGYEIVYVTFQRPIAYRVGFERIASVLSEAGQPKAALCGISLRSPRPFTFGGFAEFNAEYAAILQSWGLFVNGVNPVARTNVAPVMTDPVEPAMYGFSFTKPCAVNLPATFVVAGAGELPEGVLSREAIVALCDTSTQGLSEKVHFVMSLMENRLRGLGVDWLAVSTMNAYTKHMLALPMLQSVLGSAGPAAWHGVRWHFSSPPIEEIEFEMDMRGTRTELWLGS